MRRQLSPRRSPLQPIFEMPTQMMKSRKIVAQRVATPERDTVSELAERNRQRAEALDHMRANLRRKPRTKPDAPGADLLRR